MMSGTLTPGEEADIHIFEVHTMKTRLAISIQAQSLQSLATSGGESSYPSYPPGCQLSVERSYLSVWAYSGQKHQYT